MLVTSGGQFPSFHFLIILFIIVTTVRSGSARITSTFTRSEWPSTDIPLDNEAFAIPKGHSAPQQVHITQGDYDGKAVIITWVTTDEPGSSKVLYGTLEKKYDFSAEGNVTNYTFSNYSSGYIHHCLVHGLEHDTKYYYKIGDGGSSREFWFQTPPKIDPDTSYTFGIIGDLGQTYNSLSTLEHYMQSGAQTVLFVGDLSYADRYEFNDVGVRWDSWGRFVERSAAYQPWIWTAGNHEVEYMPNMVFSSKFVWKSQVPFKVKSFVWLVAHKKVNTNDMLQVRRPYKALSPDICILCMKHGESADHLFLHCSLTIGLWYRLFQLTKTDWVPPRSIFDMMSIKFNGFGSSKRGIVLWQAASIALIQVVWWERNTRIFEDKARNSEYLWDSIVFLASLWAFCSKVFKGTPLNVLQLDWLAVCTP